jgi:hypothetical protein
MDGFVNPKYLSGGRAVGRTALDAQADVLSDGRCAQGQ